MTFNKKKYDQQYQKENYDRIALNVKKGDKAVIAEHAKKRGFNSITDYIKHVVYKDMNEDTSKSINVGDVTQNSNSINIG